MGKELKEIREMLWEKNENTDKEITYKQEPKRNSGAKKHIHWNKIFIRCKQTEESLNLTEII